MKKAIAIILASSLLFLLCGCNKGNSDSSSDKPTISTTIFPIYNFASRIAGEKFDVKMILPAGSDSHSFDPSPDDIIKINKSKMLIHAGHYADVWLDKLINSIDSNKIIISDTSKNIRFLNGEGQYIHDEDENIKDEDSHNHNDVDPHYWTSPKNALIMADNILASICELDGENSDYYTKNASALKKEINGLITELDNLKNTKQENTLIFGGKNAFLYLLTENNLSYMGAYKSCAAHEQPDAKTIANLTDYIKENNIKIVFHEEIAKPEVATILIENTDAKLLMLHSTHTITIDELNNNATYVSLMKQNIKNIKEGF